MIYIGLADTGLILVRVDKRPAEMYKAEQAKKQKKCKGINCRYPPSLSKSRGTMDLKKANPKTTLKNITTIEKSRK